MSTKPEAFIKSQLKTNLPGIRPGDTILVSQKIREGDKERIQDFEGLVNDYGKKGNLRHWRGKDFSSSLPYY